MSWREGGGLVEVWRCMEVIGAGFGRTGTASLKAALERLGFGPCYHMDEVITSPRNSALWDRYLDAGAFDWDEVFTDYDSAVDWPVCSYYEELIVKYPQAKVVLSVRDPEAWHGSATKTIYAISEVIRRSMFLNAAKTVVPHLRRVVRLTDEIIWDGEFGGRFEDREHAIRVFERHIEGVKRTVPPERLLVYGVGEGWGPLCGFLGAEEPDEEFPRLNDTRSFRRTILALRIISFAVPAALAALSVYALVRALAGPRMS